MAIIIRQAADIPTAELDKLGPVNIPLSSPPAELAGMKFLVGRPGVRMMGVWQCSPGHWRRTIMQEEFAHFIEGSARFVPEDGAPIDIRAGDTVWFPPRSRGVWEISETVRKVYIIFYPRNPLTIAKAWLAATFATLRRWTDIPAHAQSGSSATALPRPGKHPARRTA